MNELQLWGEYSATRKVDVEALAREYMEQGRVQGKGNSPDFIDYLEGFWKQDSKYIKRKAVSIVLRLGECRALRRQYLYYQQVGEKQIPCVEVAEDGNWQDGEGFKEPKWGAARIVPVPETVYDACLEIANTNPWKNELVFYSDRDRDKPIGKHAVADALNAACVKIEMKDRKQRGITLYFWRHWYDTIIVGELPGEVRRQLIGHPSEKMDKRYIQFTDDHRQMLSNVSSKIFN